MKKRIATDLDNTIFDFSPHFEKWAESYGHNIKRGIIGQTYNFQDMFDTEIDKEEFLLPFFNCDITMATFPALDNCIEPIKRLNEHGFEFIGVTACNPRDGLAEARHKNLKNLLGFDFEEVYVTGYEKPKSPVLKKYDPSYWVEDSLLHAIEGAELGYETFLIDHPYNQGDGPFTRVTDWREIEAAILG